MLIWPSFLVLVVAISNNAPFRNDFITFCAGLCSDVDADKHYEPETLVVFKNIISQIITSLNLRLRPFPLFTL